MSYKMRNKIFIFILIISQQVMALNNEIEQGWTQNKFFLIYFMKVIWYFISKLS